ncbi:MAG: endonuclease III [Chitinispirillia bacterium]|nr:endonuclease III [Chitinispirillia bacterium]MCL2241220.1 endonuclease III [Chitinispirillia bacterium]
MKKGSPQINDVYAILAKEFKKNRTPVVDLIEIQTSDPFKVLTATILSARTKDEVTAEASRRLFERADSLQQLKKLTEEKIAELIYPAGFYKMKAKHLKQLPDVIEKEFEGKIPDDVDELTKLPGVGRKTANLVVAVAFKKPAVCVDVHVHRIFNRLGYISTNTPLETEMELRRIFPEKFWTTFNAYFVSFGQHRCKPVRPMCDGCPAAQYCANNG